MCTPDPDSPTSGGAADFMKYVFSGKRDPKTEATFAPYAFVTPAQYGTYSRVNNFVNQRPPDEFSSSYARARDLLKPLSSAEYEQILKNHLNYRPPTLTLLPDYRAARQ